MLQWICGRGRVSFVPSYRRVHSRPDHMGRLQPIEDGGEDGSRKSVVEVEGQQMRGVQESSQS